MLLAMLASLVVRQPPLVQAVVLGLCTGLFITTAANADARVPRLETAVIQVLVTGCVGGTAFYVGLSAQRRRGWTPANPGPLWLFAIYSVVWTVTLLAALLALFGNGGFKVAALAIVPLVLLAPPALQGLRIGRHRVRDGSVDP